MKLFITFWIILCQIGYVVATQLDSTQLLENQRLWQALGQGGKVILMRHSYVNKGKDFDNALLLDKTCNKERNLSAQGIKAAKKLKELFKNNNIKISSVIHSPYCRTTETANIIFSAYNPSNNLSLLNTLNANQVDKQNTRLMHIIGSYNKNDNLVLITHELNIRAVSFELIKHLDFIVFKPMGEYEYEELGVIRFDNK